MSADALGDECDVSPSRQARFILWCVIRPKIIMSPIYQSTAAPRSPMAQIIGFVCLLVVLRPLAVSTLIL